VDLLLLGKFKIDEAQNRVKVYARLVRSDSGEVLETFDITGKRDEDIQAALALQIMKKLDLQGR
jgi:hypothetical protein